MMGVQKQHNTAAGKRTAFGKKFFLAQAFACGLFLMVASTVSALAPSQASTPAQSGSGTVPAGSSPAQPPAQQPAAQPPAAQPPAAGAAAANNSQFPDNPGRATFLATCSVCHSPTNVLAYHLDRDGWGDIIQKMVGYGAQGTDEQFAQILDYLSKSYPPTK